MQNVFALYEKGLYKDVVQSVDMANFSALRDPRISRVLAASHFQLGQYAESLLLLSEIESCFSTDSDYLSLYGACLRRCGDLEGSRVQLELALKIKPEYEPIKNNYANLLIDLGEYRRAESILLHLLKINPNYSDAQVNLKRLRERQRIQQLQSKDNAIPASAKLIFDDPLMLAFDDDEVQRTRPKDDTSSKVQSDLKGKLPPLKQQKIASDQLKLALEAILEGRYNFALQLCSQAYRSIPVSAALYECVSDAYIALQRFTEAEACLLHALQLGSKSFKLYANLTSLLCIRADFALAQYYLEQASLLDENNPSLANLRLQIANSQDGTKHSMFRFDHEWLRPDMTKKDN